MTNQYKTKYKKKLTNTSSIFYLKKPFACLNYTNNPDYLYNSLFTGEITN